MPITENNFSYFMIMFSGIRLVKQLYVNKFILE